MLLVVVLFAMTATPGGQIPTGPVVRWTAAIDPTVRLDPGERVEVTVDAVIDRGWKLYALTQEGAGPQAMTFTVPDGSAWSLDGPVIAPLPFSSLDPNFGFDTQYHTEAATFYLPLRVPPAASGAVRLELDVTWQTCTDRFCLPPATRRLTLEAEVPGTGADARFLPLEEGRRGSTPAIQVEDMAAPDADGTLTAYLGLAAVMGALSLLTPCVFPMVPITVSYFAGRATGDRRRARSQALLYGAGIVLTFTGIGAVIAVGFGASGLNQFAANPWLNLTIAALFIAFALNLFGAFDLALPSRMLTRLSAAERGAAPWIGTLLMALAFTLTSFTCTAPFLGTLLVVAAQGDWLWPLAGLTVFASVFAVPFVLLAWAPQAAAALPQSGRWLLSVKAVMGLLEMAAALKFLSNVDLIWGWNVFTRDVVIALWLVVGLVLVVYLLGGLRLGHAPRLSRPRALRLVGTGGVFVFVAWMSTGLAGRRLGELEAFLPPAGLGGGHADELAWVVNDFEGGLADAQAAGQPVLIDFTGYTCTNCRWMEANMFPRPAVARELARYTRIRLYTDGRGDDYRRFQDLQRDTFGTVALPYYAVLTPQGRPLVAFGGLTRDEGLFVAFLQRGLTGS